MSIRVIVADDHPLILFGVRQTLGQALGIAVVADAPDPKVLLERLEMPGCDVLVTDFAMPCEEAADGLVMLNAIRIKFPKVRVVVLTMLENPGLVVSMRNAGVLGVIHKRDDLKELPAAIIAAFQARTYLGASIQQRLDKADARRRGGKDAIGSLSPRELEVIRLYVSGMSTTEVAKHLHRSANTISTQKHSAMKKLRVENDTELYAYAIKHGLIG